MLLYSNIFTSSKTLAAEAAGGEVNSPKPYAAWIKGIPAAEAAVIFLHNELQSLALGLMGISPAEIIGEIPLKRIIFKKRLDIPVLAVADDKKPVVFRKCGKSLLQLRIKLAAVCGMIVFLFFPAFFSNDRFLGVNAETSLKLCEQADLAMSLANFVEGRQKGRATHGWCDR